MSDDELPGLKTRREILRRAELASDPSTPLHRFPELATSHPSLVVANPAFELALVGDPHHLHRYGSTALAGILKCRDIPPMALEIAAADLHWAVSVCPHADAVLAEHPHSSSFVIDRLEEAKHPLARFHVRSRRAGDGPWEEAALDYIRRTDRTTRLQRCIGLGARLVEHGMYPMNDRFSALLADALLKRCTSPTPDWRPESCALLASGIRSADPARTLFATGCLQKPTDCAQAAIHGSMAMRIAIAVNPTTPADIVRELAEHDHQWPVVAAAREVLASPGSRHVRRALPVPRTPVRSNLLLGRVRMAFQRSSARCADLAERLEGALADKGACRVLLAGGAYRMNRFQLEPETFLAQQIARQRERLHDETTSVACRVVGGFIEANLPYALPLLG